VLIPLGAVELLARPRQVDRHGRAVDDRPERREVGVADPRSPGRCRFAVRTLGDAGIATSGDYERGFVKDGIRYHHILDARTGWPARGLSSVTAIAASAFRAGRFATAAFLLGAEAGLALIENAAGVEGALITDAGSILATTGMALLSDASEDAGSDHRLVDEDRRQRRMPKQRRPQRPAPRRKHAGRVRGQRAWKLQVPQAPLDDRLEKVLLALDVAVQGHHPTVESARQRWHGQARKP